MATAESAVPKSKQGWDGFKETTEKIKKELRTNIQSLTEAIEEVREVLNEFYKEYYNKIPCEPENINKLREDLKQVVVKLKDELKKAVSDDVTIVFVGHTSTGKSSLINALLRDRRLPVKRNQTTMCKIHVRPTADEKWSVVKIGCEKPLSDQMSKKEVKALLSKMSKPAERKKLNIDTHSVIQVNWPRHLCSLPENIVLVDTPGCNENRDGDKVVFGCCKEADILVAVIDSMSPVMLGIETLLNNLDCQPNFGVFTKWDQDFNDEEEEEEEPEQDDEESGYEKTKTTVEEGERQLTRKEYEKEFQSSFGDKCKVYFVDARHFTKAKDTPQGIEGREDFLRFEIDLAQRAKSAKARKCVVMIGEVENATSKYEKTLKDVQSILTEINGKISTLEKEYRSLDAVNHEVQKLNDLINRFLTEEEIDRLKEELGNKIERCSTVDGEDKAVNEFFEKKIGGINKALQEQTLKIVEEFEKRKGDLQSLHAVFCEKLMPSCEAKKQKTAEDCSYNSLKDPYAYITNSKVWATLFSTLVAAATTTAFVTTGACTGLVAAIIPETASALAISAAGRVAAGLLGGFGFGGTLGFSTVVENFSGVGVAQKIRSHFGPSKMKVDSITQFARELLMEIKKQFEECVPPLSKILELISNEVSLEIKNCSSGAKSSLREELNQLTEWLEKLTESTKRLQEVQKEFGELKDGLSDKDTVPLDDQTENQSPVQPED